MSDKVIGITHQYFYIAIQYHRIIYYVANLKHKQQDGQNKSYLLILANI